MSWTMSTSQHHNSTPQTRLSNELDNYVNTTTVQHRLDCLVNWTMLTSQLGDGTRNQLKTCLKVRQDQGTKYVI